MQSDHNSDHKGHRHHILSNSTSLAIFVALIVGTVITVGASRIDLHPFNFAVAMLIATVKALLVILFFMGLKYDSNDNRVIFGISIIFVAIFIVLTMTDLFWRKGPYVDVNNLKAAIFKDSGPKITQMKFWEQRPELLNRGKELYQAQCVACHGATGHGDGVAAAGLNPKPRNFTVGDGWKNGRKPSQVFGTLTNGLNQMPSFKTALPPDDRFALAFYVLSLGPAHPGDTPDDLKSAGVDTSKPDGGFGGATEKSLPIDFAIELLSKENS